MAAKIKCFLPRVVPLLVIIVFLLTIRMIQAGIEVPPQPEEKVAEAEPVGVAPSPVEAPQAPTAPPPPSESVEPVAANQPAQESAPAVVATPVIVATPPEAPPAEALTPTDQPAPAVANEEAVAKSGSETDIKEKEVVETTPPAEAAASAPPPAPSAPAMEYQGVYKSGNAPLKEKTKVRIFRSGDAYFFAHREESGSWSVQLESTRGAQATEKGIWFYWFDATDNTLNAYFEVSQNPQQLVSEINAAVTEFNNKMSDTAYKQRYEEYRQKALQESK